MFVKQLSSVTAVRSPHSAFLSLCNEMKCAPRSEQGAQRRQGLWKSRERKGMKGNVEGEKGGSVMMREERPPCCASHTGVGQ